MKVYVVTREIPYGPMHIIGVFAKKADADDCAKQFAADDRANWDCYGVEEWDVK